MTTKKTTQPRLEAKLAVSRARNGFGWSRGAATVGTRTYRVEIKWFDEPSQFGIKNGRVSKLWVSDDEGPVINYDRGWDTRPATAEAKAILKAVLKEFN